MATVSPEVAEPVNSETVAGLRAMEMFCTLGDIKAASVTLPAKSSRLARSKLKVASWPWGVLWLTGAAAMVKSGGFCD